MAFSSVSCSYKENKLFIEGALQEVILFIIILLCDGRILSLVDVSLYHIKKIIGKIDSKSERDPYFGL